MAEEEDTSKPEVVPSAGQVFSLSGPTHLTAIDWRNFQHRRSVAASLVQGVYMIERDRQQQRQGLTAQAPPWWDAIHFRLVRVLEDEDDKTIFGAIYQLKTFAFNYCYSTQDAPTYVIAFRGTILECDSFKRDLMLDLFCLCNRLHSTTRFEIAVEALQGLVAAAGAQNIWLSGHSLGSAIALLAGKSLARTGYPVEAYLFNPPFPSAPLEMINNKKLKRGIRVTSSVIKSGLAIVLKDNNQREAQEDEFASTSSWLPHLFVNPDDPICSGYVGYFEHRVKMGRLAGHNSMAHLISGAAAGRDTEPFHLVPSAFLSINMSESPGFKRAHGIHQWWDPNLKIESVSHRL